jgi:guanylate kinase
MALARVEQQVQSWLPKAGRAERARGAAVNPGNLFVVAAAPSGAGKSSLVKALLELDSHLAVSVSHTTRAPRGQEQHGREYWFVAEPAFRAMVERGEFFEWAEVHGNLYGTSRKAIEDRLPPARTWCWRSTGRARCRSSSCSRTRC